MSGFTYSAYGPFTINKERIKKFKETGDSTIFKLYSELYSKQTIFSLPSI